ncbi:MAG: glycosyltransferase family protein [Proteobacteria bacterium]|nr:glycosyltransferase family protein [Pseudomonadota bacterium]
MRTAVIIQARMTSSRLPGKVMLPLWDKTVLGQVLSRCQQIKNIDVVCCAIPLGKDHDVLIAEAEKYNAVIFRGSELNVLERYYEAAKHLKADIIMRVTSDCPLINPEVCSDVLQMHIQNKAEYTCNNLPPTWPHGYDCEVFGIEELKNSLQYATHPEDFEHVTEWMRRTLKVHNFENPEGNHRHIRITLDTPEDYAFIKKINPSSTSLKLLLKDVDTLTKNSSKI